MKIGILITGHVPDALIGEHGDYDRFFTRFLDGYGFDFQAWAVVDGVFPGGIDEADGWLITGSRHGAYEDHPWIPPLEDFIREIHAAKQPLVGICFGHQVIAQALGGKVEKFAGGWTVGRTEYQTTDGPLALNAWHQDQVTELPDGARVLGSNATCANAVLAYDDHIWTVQPHPEFSQSYVPELIAARGRGLVPDTLLDAALDANAGDNDNKRIADHIAGFFKRARVPA